MPIKACADRLKREIEDFGNPPVFSAEETPAPAEKSEEKKADPLAFHAKKSKVVAKSSGASRQWNIMQSLGVPSEEIHKFADASHWLHYFPPFCKTDLQSMGLGVDWRRSFITTDVNPYYDSFVRWQFETLHDLGKVKFGKRYTIWSPLDGQPCMDHDRSAGEGVQAQEYTLIKLEVIAPFPEKLQPLKDFKVYLVPGTLRPETMYGQTNCWILPEGKYVAARINETDVFICTARAARNMSYQGLSREDGKVEILLEISGADLLGLPLKAPLAKFERVYVLPMMHINPEKGTGVVTSVPSDAPDDYAALNDLRTKQEYYNNKFGLKPEWVLPFEPIPIIMVPEFGDLSAVKACADLKIKSQNDRKALDQAKDLVYMKGFYEGEMLVGEHKGKKVKDAKPIIKDEMISRGEAVVYSEPADKIVSRSGDECVVALTDQWYQTYGEKEWRDKANDALAKLDTFSEETRTQFNIALGWMNQWACSRTYGLGTRLPFDPRYLIESLSDSTIYMAYYTIAHLLQGGVFDGSKPGSANVKPEQMTREVWDHIFRNGPAPKTDIPTETLALMKKEFNYWYPVDLRVSGKDLIQNHLTFFIYNHTALFPEHQWPKGIRANGHILLNGDKMSKSTGNFLTLSDAVDKYSADGMRFGLADAGDTLDDANFMDQNATAGLLRLYVQIVWVEDVMGSLSSLRSGPTNSFMDVAFESAINRAIEETERYYERTQYREALRTGFHELQSARDHYRTVAEDVKMHRDLVLKFIEVQALLICPICPHFAEKVWKLLGKTGSVLKASWPSVGPIDKVALSKDKYIEDILYNFRSKIGVFLKKAKNAKVTEAEITVSLSFPEWHRKALEYMHTVYNKQTKEFKPDSEMLEHFRGMNLDAAVLKKVMSLIVELKNEVKTRGEEALQLKLPFDEKELIESSLPYVCRSLEVGKVVVKVAAEGQEGSAVPGKPSFAVTAHTPAEEKKDKKKK